MHPHASRKEGGTGWEPLGGGGDPLLAPIEWVKVNSPPVGAPSAPPMCSNPEGPVGSSQVVRQLTHERDAMSPRRRIALPLTAGAAALALVLASCSSSEPQPDPTEETSTEPSVSLRLPDGFDNQAPMWSAITDLPLGDILYSDISNDGQFYGYAALRNETLSIRQVNLPTGQRTEALEVPRLSGVQEPELGGWASLSYQDDQLVLTQAGHTVDETNSERDPEHTTAHLRVDIFEVGKSSDPTTLEKDSPR